MALFENFHKGFYESEYVQDGFADLVNCDIHSKLGTLQAQVLLIADDTGTDPDEQSILVSANNGEIFAVSRESGKIWKRTTGGTWSLVRTNANGAHVGAGAYNNRLWYFTSTKLGYFDFSSTWDDSHGTFGNTVTTRPFIKGGVNRAFAYIGDGAQIARVDKDNGFSANVLEVPLGLTITDIAEWGNDLVMTEKDSNNGTSSIRRWNQYGDTYYRPDLIAYPDVDMLLPSQNSNIIYAMVRDKDGNVDFMYYTGQELNEIEQRHIVDTTEADSYLKCEFDGRVHFAVNDKVYSIRDRALVCEYTATSRIYGICTNGTDLFVSCGSNGVYKTGANRADAVITTPIVEGKLKSFVVMYESVPSGTAISAKASINGGSFETVQVIDEPQHSRYIMREGFADNNINFAQIQVTLEGDSTNTPVIRAIEVA